MIKSLNLPERKFINVSKDELMRAVIEMSQNLGISNSVADIYSISGALFTEHDLAIQRTKDKKAAFRSIK
jgi:hypothetical protein